MLGDVVEFLADVVFAVTGAKATAGGRTGRWWRRRFFEVFVAACLFGAGYAAWHRITG